MSNILEEIGEKYNPTKRYHDYLRHYWRHFGDRRFEVKKFCEIGLQTDKSIRMWEEFFPEAEIFGIDIDPKCRELAGGRKKVFIGNQGDQRFLSNFVNEVGGALDIVIDDGSHNVQHQLASFAVLFPALSSHGIYVIEDTGGLVGDTDLSTVNVMKTMIDHIMYWPKGMHGGNWPFVHKFPPDASWMDCNIVGAAFYRWIIFIMRGNNPGDNPYLRRPTQNDTLVPNQDGSLPTWLYH